MRGELERAKVHEGEGTGGCTVLHAEQLDKRALGEGREYSRTEAAKREKKGEGEGGGAFDASAAPPSSMSRSNLTRIFLSSQGTRRTLRAYRSFAVDRDPGASGVPAATTVSPSFFFFFFFFFSCLDTRVIITNGTPFSPFLSFLFFSFSWL